ncbi:sel1 repeat family protein [Novosphingobium flavum]|uniref:Sel1 repeat family protein n=1 Tax=Novosphingobium aerophilum TaxID=2839843 RepID=A0A7X1FB11_9SPHN|nr:sel1 repeat family protein [Novosphingobium aerophilum]MBC2663887.1 sel1 repeat family protein [Novosphingobium aerophilum]
MIGADRLEIQRVALRVAAGLALGASALVGGCAAPTSYMGLNLTAPDLSADVRELARRAQAGDKQAQLDLGIAFEEGRGVVRDTGRARRLYALAASDSGGPSWVYVPPVVSGQAGRVVQVGSGLPQRGLKAARIRLGMLHD